MRIIKRFKSETAHIVRNAFSERCAFSFHGHSYVYEVAIDGNIQGDGMVLDFKRLIPIKLFIDQFDHSAVLWDKEKTEVKDFFIKNFDRVLVMKKNPTAENMVRIISRYTNNWLENNFQGCTLGYIRIWETDTGSAQDNNFDEEDTFTYISRGIQND